MSRLTTLSRLLALCFVLVSVFVALRPSVAQDAPNTPSHDGQNQACSHCHEDPHSGEVGQTCSSCHNQDAFTPSTFTVVRHAELSFALHGKHKDVKCNQCHTKGKLKGLPTACNECHLDRHRGKLGEDCTQCHSTDGFTPVDDFDHRLMTGFALDGHHGEVKCETCHKGARGSALRSVLEPSCTTCHQPQHGDFRKECVDCHQDAHTSFAESRKHFDHRSTPFPLERRHKSVACAGCHEQGKPSPMSRCQSCHRDIHAGQLGTRCDDCHKPDRWSLARFDHDLAGWPLKGRHFVTPCESCHTGQRWMGLTNQCWDCHALDAARAPKTVRAHAFGRVDCGDCHSQWTWR